MTCPDELALAMHADDALMALEAMEMEQHLAGCERCRARVGALREESRILGTALAVECVAARGAHVVQPAGYRRDRAPRRARWHLPHGRRGCHRQVSRADGWGRGGCRASGVDRRELARAGARAVRRGNGAMCRRVATDACR